MRKIGLSLGVLVYSKVWIRVRKFIRKPAEFDVRKLCIVRPSSNYDISLCKVTILSSKKVSSIDIVRVTE